MDKKEKIAVHADHYSEDFDFVQDDEFWAEVLITVQTPEPTPEPVPEPHPEPKTTSGEPDALALIKKLKRISEASRNELLSQYIENDVEAAWATISVLLQVEDESIRTSVKTFIADEIDGPDHTLLQHLEKLLLIPENFTSDFAIQALIDSEKKVYIDAGADTYQAFLLKKALAIQGNLSTDFVQTRSNYDQQLSYLEAEEWYDDKSVDIHTPKSGFDTEQMFKIPWLEKAIQILSKDNVSHTKLAALGLKLSKLQYEVGRVLSMVDFLTKVAEMGEQLQVNDDDSYWTKAYTFESHKTKKQATESIIEVLDVASKLGKTRGLISVQNTFNKALPKLGVAMKYDIRTGLKRVHREVGAVLWESGNQVSDQLPGPATVWASKEWGESAGKEYKSLAKKMDAEVDDIAASLLALPNPTSAGEFHEFVKEIADLFERTSSLQLQAAASHTARIMVISSKNKFFTEQGWWNETMKPFELKRAFGDVFDGLLDFIDQLQNGGNLKAIAAKMEAYLDPEQNDKMALVRDIIAEGSERAGKFKRFHSFVVTVLAIVGSIYASFAAVSLLRGGLSKLSPALVKWAGSGFLGKATGFLSATAVEALIFEMTNQGLVRMQGGEPESFGEGYAKNFAMVGLFKLLNLGMLARYPKPKNGTFMQNLKHAGAEHVAHFLFFQGWAEAMYRLERGEWPEGVEHWEIAKDNAFLLGMVKITVSATFPFPRQKIGDLTLREIDNLNKIIENRGRELQDLYKEDAAPEDISKAADKLKELIDRRQRYHQALFDAEVIDEAMFEDTKAWARNNKTALDYLKDVVKFDLKPVQGHENTFTFEGDITGFKEFMERVGLEEAPQAKGEKPENGILRYLRGQSQSDTAIITIYQRGVLPAGEAIKNRTTAKQAIEALNIDFVEAQAAIKADGSTYLNQKLRFFAEYYKWTPAQGIDALPLAEQARINTYLNVKALYPQVTDKDAIAGLALLSDQVPEILDEYAALSLGEDVLTEAGLLVWKSGQRGKAENVLRSESSTYIASDKKGEVKEVEIDREEFIRSSQEEFNSYDSQWIKENPFTGENMFNKQTGGFVVTHKKHNNIYEHEFTMGEAFASDGHKVELLSEKAEEGVPTPDAKIFGEGIWDFKNINPNALSKNITRNIESYVLVAKRQADNIAFNLIEHPGITPEMVNTGVRNAMQTVSMSGTSSYADKVGVVYKNGNTKIISINEFKTDGGERF